MSRQTQLYYPEVHTGALLDDSAVIGGSIGSDDGKVLMNPDGSEAIMLPHPVHPLAGTLQDDDHADQLIANPSVTVDDGNWIFDTNGGSLFVDGDLFIINSISNHPFDTTTALARKFNNHDPGWPEQSPINFWLSRPPIGTIWSFETSVSPPDISSFRSPSVGLNLVRADALGLRTVAVRAQTEGFGSPIPSADPATIFILSDPQNTQTVVVPDPVGSLVLRVDVEVVGGSVDTLELQAKGYFDGTLFLSNPTFTTSTQVFPFRHCLARMEITRGGFPSNSALINSWQVAIN